jgi:hypothetical protein
MKKITISLLVLVSSLSIVLGQSYLAVTTQKANLRDMPEKGSEVLDLLKANAQIFVYSSETTGGYYNVIDIETDQEGWVHSSLVKLVEEIQKSDVSPFSPEGRTSGTECLIEVTNNTSLSMTLKMNATYYYFDPRETKTLTFSPGAYTYVASAPSVIPYFGDDTLQSGYKYSWIFYVETVSTPGKTYYSKRKKRRN